MVTEIENFLKQYNALAGKEFNSIGWEEKEKARESITNQILKK